MLLTQKTIRRSLALSLLTAAGAQAQQKTAPMNPGDVPGRQITIPQQPPRDVPPPNIGELMRSSNGSLYRAASQMPNDPRLVRAADVSLVAVPVPKPKIMQKHDLLTIIVREQSEYTSEGGIDAKKSAGFDAKIEQFPKFDLADFTLGNAITNIKPQIKLTGDREFKGEGNVDRKDSLTARIQAEVVDVKPNGTLVVQARKRIKTDEEEQLFVLTGVCRVQDVTPDNSVLSTQLYDLDVRKTHTGVVRDATKRGWIPRAVDWINPF
ncbi:MAG TPA: flagellar basal body L-ring protein FlgH [Tepidisphaeraceae bacterium]|jgi:flagellar L-ring protein precursor FlgH